LTDCRQQDRHPPYERCAHGFSCCCGVYGRRHMSQRAKSGSRLPRLNPQQ
jgi:hypothetical protein